MSNLIPAPTRLYTIDDLYYFRRGPTDRKKEYAAAKEVQDICSQSSGDREDYSRRLYLLTRVTDPSEHYARAGDFMSEVNTFSHLHKRGLAPHWVPESAVKNISTPDIRIVRDEKTVGVEVKTLNLSKVERDALWNGYYEAGPDWNYFEGIEKKLKDFFADTVKKMECFNEDGSIGGILHLHYFPGQHVRFRDGEDGLPSMVERLKHYASHRLPQEVELNLYNVLD